MLGVFIQGCQVGVANCFTVSVPPHKRAPAPVDGEEGGLIFVKLLSLLNLCTSTNTLFSYYYVLVLYPLPLGKDLMTHAIKEYPEWPKSIQVDLDFYSWLNTILNSIQV